jgi:hypothetical protein
MGSHAVRFGESRAHTDQWRGDTGVAPYQSDGFFHPSLPNGGEGMGEGATSLEGEPPGEPKKNKSLSPS